ncbi:hypothetical protein CC1G_08827 [Coprinopsis cinerea okayama7|uniref:Transcription initiation factor TFIID subunit 4 n=1 Tax=Coprinopsis cinerea (strain Okayama-7 / 130 / ATCC MYA-4618 / FGSC 9003) TaxID=240176 RepID=A8P685_COPC7|nr:hypothetical protein CC1G_08827 [Coprinopsis cinerea okayama7\|eukprot:XP_001839101.2 hypothetical protein CC1G_08827 [Coprinopsis cinerea okayama7\
MTSTPTSSTPTPVTMAAQTTVQAGTPVQTYPSPAHAQWAAGQLQVQMDTAQQQQQQAAAQQSQTPTATAASVTAPKPQHATQSYYQSYTHYPYYQQYIAQAVAAQQAQQQAAAAASQHQAHTPTPVATAQRASVPAATPAATATSTPVAPAHTPAVATAQTTTAPVTAAMPAAQAANANTLDTSDISTLNDALGSAGVDLRAEEESLQRHDAHGTSHLQSHSLYMQNRPYEDRSRKQPVKPAFDTRALGTTMRAIGSQHKVTKIPDESINYLALALRARLQDLVTAMIRASKYRKQAQFDRPASFYETLNNVNNAMDVDGVKMESQTPMWSVVVRSDVGKQLAALEKAEREEEMRIRRERKERQEMAAANLASMSQAGTPGADPSLGANALSASGGSEEPDGQPKKKKKKDGPGVTARNMSEDVRKKMSNAVATQAAGLGKYAWMTAAASSPSPAPKPKASTSTTATGSGTTPASSWARPYVPKKPQQQMTTTTTPEQKTEVEDPNKVVVTMRDAMFVVEKERGHGGGRGAARGWT